MTNGDCYEVLMWSDGYEGRLWEWRSTRWRVLEYYNYRHTFEECDITPRDIVALRRQFNLLDNEIPNSELLKLSPDELARVSGKVTSLK